MDNFLLILHFPVWAHCFLSLLHSCVILYSYMHPIWGAVCVCGGRGCTDVITWCGGKRTIFMVILQELCTFHVETASLISLAHVKKGSLASQ